ncbi:MAG: ankyrin repeat domain-containing protein [Acidobacteriota bacterium]|nr:MAG: ankyrin repeat domain-containing protein [Acidobacteriota bacterium]
MEGTKSTLHYLLDWDYGPEGESKVRELVAGGADVNGIDADLGEAPIHTAARRRRLDAIELLLELGADIDSRTEAGKTAYAHAIRRGFEEISDFLEQNGADTTLNPADQFAVAVIAGDLEEAARILGEHPGVVKTGNPEEDRLFADVSGRPDPERVRFLIEAGADLSARGLDGGTPLHQAAWFGEPDNARLLIDAGAPLDVFDDDHQSSPLHWAVHGSRFSGGAEERQDRYVRLVEMLLEAGSSLHYPGDDSDTFIRRMYLDGSDRIREVLRQKGVREPDQEE